MPEGDRVEPLPIAPEMTRYASLALPGHRYLPGVNERPAGGSPFVRPSEVPWERLAETELFRHGVDLYNNAFFWEAHEAWETLWQECPAGPLREGLQGLIQLAAALLKEHLAVPGGARKLSRTAREHLERARVGGAPLPLDLAGLIARTEAHFARLDDPEAPEAPRPAITLQRR
jgi:hypothetical protein